MGMGMCLGIFGRQSILFDVFSSARRKAYRPITDACVREALSGL
jgi:hypothetical protein